jgi:hypothetical protein
MMATNFLNFGPELDRIDANVQTLLASLKNLATLSNQDLILAQLATILSWPGAAPGVATRVQICRTSYTPIHGGTTVAGTITLTDDHIAHTPVKWADDVGTVHAPTDAAVASSDTTVATVAFNSDMTDIDITPVADGTCTVTVTSASLSLSDNATVNVGAPVASSVTVDAADTTFTAKP